MEFVYFTEVPWQRWPNNPLQLKYRFYHKTGEFLPKKINKFKGNNVTFRGQEERLDKRGKIQNSCIFNNANEVLRI